MLIPNVAVCLTTMWSACLQQEAAERQEPPLIKAIAHNDLQTVKAEIKRNPEAVDAVDGFGYSALYYASDPSISDKIFSVLLSSSLKPEASFAGGSTVVHALCGLRPLTFIGVRSVLHSGQGEKGQITKIKAFSDRYPDLFRQPDAHGYSPLASAARHNLLSALSYLLHKGVKDPDAILYATSSRVVSVLLDFGSDPNRSDQRTNALASYAWFGTDLRGLQHLLGRGAKYKAEQDGNTPLLRLATNQYLDSRSFEPAAKLLLSHGASPNERNNSGETMLLAAVSSFMTDRVQTCLRLGADPMAVNSFGENALHILCLRRLHLEDAAFEKALRLLLKAKCPPNVRNAGGLTAADILGREPPSPQVHRWLQLLRTYSK